MSHHESVVLLLLLLGVMVLSSNPTSPTSTTGTTIVFNVTEEAVTGTLVGLVVGGTHSSRRRYLLLPVYDHADFRLDELTSGLRTLHPIDRDSRCPGAATCRLRLAVAVSQPLAEFTVYDVGVDLLDVDDLRPLFPVTKVTVILPETSAPGTRLRIPTAVDRDSPRFSRIHYRLRENDAVFRLDADTSTGSLWLTTRVELDRENADQYQVVVVTSDDLGNEDYLKVKVNVTDVNDNAPVFDVDKATITLNEDTKVIFV